MRTKGTILGIVLGLAIGLTIGGSVAQTGRGDDPVDDIMISVGWVAKLAEERYVEELDYDKLLEGATQGILATMDPYSSYLPPDMNKEFQDSTKGEFGGLGIQIQFMPIEKVVRVESPIPGTPAFRKGVLAGDMIYEIVEKATGEVIKTDEFETVHDAVRVLRGEPGTKVTIKVLRGDTGRRASFTITRAIIEIPGVRGAEIIDQEHKIGYVYIPHFHQRMVDDLKESLAKLQDQGMRGPRCPTCSWTRARSSSAPRDARSPKRSIPHRIAMTTRTWRSWCWPTATARARARS
jgi:carboxyl-terminal processing protease